MKLYFPKYIDKVVIIEIKQTVIQFGYTGRIFQYVFICLKKIRVQTLEKWSAGDGVS